MDREKKTDIPNEEIKDEAENTEDKENSEAQGAENEECRSGQENADSKAEGADAEDAAGTGQSADGAENAEEQQEEQESESERYMRLMADFQNYKRRSEKERSDIYSFANEKIITELLTVADNFERALASADRNESFVKGMEMIFDQLIGVMTKSGTEEIKALGEDFDPNFHNAVMTEESSEYESGKVTEVLQKGYILNGKVIRPSMVKVAN